MIKIKFKLNIWLKLNSFLSRHEKECDDLKPASTTQGSILYGIAFYCICDQNYLVGLRNFRKIIIITQKFFYGDHFLRTDCSQFKVNIHYPTWISHKTVL